MFLKILHFLSQWFPNIYGSQIVANFSGGTMKFIKNFFFKSFRKAEKK